MEERDDQSVSKTDEPDEHTAISDRSPIRRRNSGAQIRFMKVQDHPEVACVQLLLCNISDRPLCFKLKSNAGDSVSALPSGAGHVAARGTTRCVLTWQRPAHLNNWEDVEPPKMLLVTRFLDGTTELKNDVTSTRLLAYVAKKGTCPANKPPSEQLLFDAASKQVDEGPISVSLAKSADKSDSEIGADGSAAAMALIIAFLVFLFFLTVRDVLSSSRRH